MKGQLLKRQSLTFCEQGAFINHPDRRTRALLTSTSEPCSGRSEGLMCMSLCKDTDCFHVCWVNIRNLSLEFGDVCVIQKLFCAPLFRKGSTAVGLLASCDTASAAPRRSAGPQRGSALPRRTRPSPRPVLRKRWRASFSLLWSVLRPNLLHVLTLLC